MNDVKMLEIAVYNLFSILSPNDPLVCSSLCGDGKCLIPKSVIDEYNRRCEGKNDDEKADVFSLMMKENPFLVSFVEKFNDKEWRRCVCEEIAPIENEIMSLEGKKMSIIKKWVYDGKEWE